MRASVGSVGDEERREKAMRMAMQLAQAMGLDNSGSDGDEHADSDE